MRVTPYAGVWIEMVITTAKVNILSSLPTRECGLKLRTGSQTHIPYPVTPYAGVWIEIVVFANITTTVESLPTRECGLK